MPSAQIRTHPPPLGNYTARVKVGGAVFEKKIKVETIDAKQAEDQPGFWEGCIPGKNSPNTGNLQAALAFRGAGKT